MARGRSRRLWLVLAAVVVLLGAVTMAGTCGVGLFAWMCSISLQVEDMPVTVVERALVIDAEDLAALDPTLVPDPTHESLTRTLDAYGAVAVQYEWDSPVKGSSVVCGAHVERSDADAHTLYVILEQSTAIGLPAFSAGETTQVELDHHFAWGDESSYARLERGGSTRGYSFTGRSGRRVYSLLLLGVSMDHQDFEDLLAPHLDQMLTYAP